MSLLQHKPLNIPCSSWHHILPAPCITFACNHQRSVINPVMAAMWPYLLTACFSCTFITTQPLQNHHKLLPDTTTNHHHFHYYNHYNHQHHTVIVFAGSADQPAVLEAIAAAMTGTALKQQQQQQQPPADGDPSVAAAVAGGGAAADGVDAGQRVLLMHQAARAGQLKPTMATTNPSLMATNLLHEIDQAVQVGGWRGRGGRGEGRGAMQR